MNGISIASHCRATWWIRVLETSGHFGNASPSRPYRRSHTQLLTSLDCAADSGRPAGRARSLSNTARGVTC